MGVVGVTAIIVLLVSGRRVLTLWARHMASRQMNRWALSAAQQWLAKAAWLDPGDGMTDWMQAVCYRRLDQMDRWSESLLAAERKGAPAALLRQEMELGRVRAGELHAGDELRLGKLTEDGASPHDVAATLVHGYLLRGDRSNAKRILDAWGAVYRNEAHVAYMRGVYRYLQEQPVEAMAEFEDAVGKQPRHEPARRAIAELCETGYLLDQALHHYVAFSTHSPASADAKVGLARVLRRLGRALDARDVLQSLASDAEPPSIVAIEMGQLEFESANYEEAERWFARADLDREDSIDTLAAAGTAFAFSQKPARAQRLFARRDAARSDNARMHDLQVRLAVDPQDEQAAGELRRILDASTAVSEGAGGTAARQLPEDWKEDRSLSGPELYARHCGACHGDSGDGRGPAAWLLFPRPRDFRSERFRLVSTRNGVPTLEDLVAVSKRGMPGTSMPPFENLNDDQHELVAQEVVRIHREGVRDHFVDVMRKEGEEIDEEDVRQVVTNCTVPVDIVDDPEIGPPSAGSIARGKSTYLQLGCHKCHGNDGVGAWDLSLANEKGYPTRPRDLVHEPLKGGQEPEGIYRRISLGMPGTPHPASWNLRADQLIDVVHYCRSLSREPKRELTNHQRAILASGRAYLSTFGGSPAPDGND